MDTPDRLFSIKESRPLTGLGPTKTYEAIKLGRLAAVKVGARTLIPASEIARFRASLPVVGRKFDDQRAA